MSGAASTAAPVCMMIFGLPLRHTQLEEERPQRRVRNSDVKSRARLCIPRLIMACARNTAADSSRDPMNAAAKRSSILG